ncbi:MAG: hypothetical protein J5972_04205, partial [Eubacterium sp.]|nr:hypothetical protein [Eubacterium sp.]
MKKKVIRIVILLLVVGVLGTAGYYLYAKMNDPQTEALELLQQLPDKLSYNLGNNILGTADLKKNCEQNGTDVRIRLSNTEESDVAKAYLQKAFPKFQEITDLHLALDLQIDDTKKRVDMSANNEKDTIQGTAYFEGDNLQVYLPGLTNEDAIYRSESLKENVEQEEWNQFKNDVNEFLTEQCTDMFQVASCEKIRDKSDAGEQTHELTVQTDAFADFLDECYRFVESRDEIVAFINEKIMVKDGDFLRVLRRKIDEVQKQDNEYQVQVVGKDGVLVAVLMNHPVLGTLDLTFQQEEKSYNRVISYENSKNQTKVSIAIEEKNE